MPFINTADSSRDLPFFMLSFISSFEIVCVVISDPNIFLWIAASVADAAAANPNVIKTLLANGLSTFPATGNQFFSNRPKRLSGNPPDYPILCNWVFDNLILADEFFAKALGSLETCVLVNSNLCGKLFPSLESPTMFDQSFKVTSVLFFIPDFNSIY